MSATGNPRNKVGLKPGHSLMDWIRLGKSGEDLTGTKGAVLQVSKEQLAKHSTENDAWICLRGNIYNITRYKNFHPGGVEELMKGAGIDATSLFNKVHPWVNFESILRQCYVGTLTNMVEEDVFDFAGPSKKTSKVTNNFLSIAQKSENEMKLDWYQQENFVTMVIYSKEFPRKLHLHGELIENLEICLNDASTVWHFPHPIIWPPLLTVTESKIEGKFTKEKPMTWSNMPTKLETDSKDQNSYWPMVIKHIEKINHNVFLISLLNTKRTLSYVPIGFHVPVKASIKGTSIERNYTPVCGLSSKLLHDVNLVVKCYPDGMFSSWFTSRKVGDVVMVGNPVGAFTTEHISKASQIVLIAAGTGFTPMVRIIDWALARRNKVSEVKLIFFNKMEKDIIWRSEIEKLLSMNKRFKVNHVLSEADSLWKDTRGWVTPQLLQGCIPDFSVDNPLKYFVCVCGPIAFTQLTERYLQDMGYSHENYFCFRG